MTEKNTIVFELKVECTRVAGVPDTAPPTEKYLHSNGM